MGDEYELTGPGWSEVKGYPKAGERVRIDRVSPSGRMWFTRGGDVYFLEAEGKWAAKKITRKRLRDYTDLSDGDVVVIAGVECAIGEKVYGDATMWRLGDSRDDGFIRVTHGLVANMLVDEVRRAKRKVWEIVLRECDQQTPGAIKFRDMPAWFTIVEKREVEDGVQ